MVLFELCYRSRVYRGHIGHLISVRTATYADVVQSCNNMLDFSRGSFSGLKVIWLIRQAQVVSDGFGYLQDVALEE